MELVRTNDLQPSVKHISGVPSNLSNTQGLFFALGGKNDLPKHMKFCSADLVNLLKHGKLWIGVAGTNPNWARVNSVKDLPKFKSFVVDDYEACFTGTDVFPYMPQFFWQPNNTFRGARTFKRCRWF